MKQTSTGHLFSLVHASGDILYPARMKNNSTGVVAYRVSLQGNTLADCIELQDEHEVLRYVRDLGYGVRAKSRTTTRNGIYKLAQRSIVALQVQEKETP